MAAESCAYSSGATRLLYVIATDCAVRLALRAGLRLAPSLSTTLLYRAKAAARNVIHFVRAATACLGCSVQCAALLHCNASIWGTALHAGVSGDRF